MRSYNSINNNNNNNSKTITKTINEMIITTIDPFVTTTFKY